MPVSTFAKNIAVFFDDALSMNSQMQRIYRQAYFHCIGKIRNLLDRKTTEIMIHSYVTYRLDNGNCLLYGISDHLLTKLHFYCFCYCNIINYYLFLISTIFNIYYLSTILLFIYLFLICNIINYYLSVLVFLYY